MKNKKLLAPIFFCLLFSLNVIFYYIYFALLDFSLTLLHLFFIATTTMSVILLFSLWRNWFWSLMNYLFIAITYFVSLVNFAYYKVFNNFLDFSLTSGGGFNWIMLADLRKFYFLVPVKLYLLAGAIFFACCVNLFLFRRFSMREAQKVLFNYSGFEFVSKSKRRDFGSILILLLLFILINIGVFGLSSYLYNNPKETWWNIKNQLVDLGFWGNFYRQLLPDKQEQIVDNDYFSLTKSDFSELRNLTFDKENKILTWPQIDRPNILLVQLESTQNWAIDNTETPMPFLKKILKENAIVSDFHSSSCETINSEFAALCSFWPKSDRPISGFLENDFSCLPEILKNEKNYATYFFHANVPEFWNRDHFVEEFGFEKSFFSPFFDRRSADKEFYEKIVVELQKEKRPFFAQAVTILTHSPHSDEIIEFQNRVHNASINPFGGKIDEKILENISLDKHTLRNYLGFLQKEDDALKFLFSELERTGLAQNTVVILYGDHRFYNFKGTDKVYNFQKYNRLPLAIVWPEKVKGTLAQIGSQIDIAPTILQLIEKDNYYERPQFFGTSLLSEKHPDLAVNKCLDQIYLQSRDFTVIGNSAVNQYETILKKDNQLKNEQLLTHLKNFIIDSDAVLDKNQLK